MRSIPRYLASYTAELRSGVGTAADARVGRAPDMRDGACIPLRRRARGEDGVGLRGA